MEKSKHKRGPGWSLKPVLAVAAVAVSAALHAGVLVLFHEAAPSPWLRASRGLEAALASCRAQPARRDRQRCAQRVVAAAQGASASQLAAASQP